MNQLSLSSFPWEGLCASSRQRALLSLLSLDVFTIERDVVM